MKMLLPVAGILIAAVAALSLYLFKQGLDNYLAGQSLASVEIAAPADMQVINYDPTQGATLTDVVFDPDPEATDPTNTLLRQFDAAARGVDDGVARVFAKGSERAAISVRRVPYVAPAATLASRLGLEEPNPQPKPVPDVFGTVAGIAVVKQAAPDLALDRAPVSYRHFVASLGDASASETLQITVLTTASDAFVASVFAGLDIAAFNEKLPEPDVRIMPDAGFVPAADGALSQTPPPKSVALLAYQLLQTDPAMAAPDRAVLDLIRMGEIADYADLQARFPNMLEPTAPVLAVFGPPAPAVAARYAAARLLVENRDWNQVEAYILSQVAIAGTTQADLSEYMDTGRDVSEQVRALVADLPATSRGD